MTAFEPTVQPSSIGPSGVIAQVLIPPGYRRFKVARILIVHTAGSLSNFEVEVSSDPLAVDVLRRITSYGNRLPLDTIDDDNAGVGYSWAGGEVAYVRVVPNTGTDNSFKISLFMDVKR